MSFWNYVGEFFLFRWLFGLFRHDDMGTQDSDDDMDSPSQSDDDFLDEQDDYDMMDDDF